MKSLALGAALLVALGVLGVPAFACSPNDTACWNNVNRLRSYNQLGQQLNNDGQLAACKIGCVENNNDYDAQTQCEANCAQANQ
ncbi:MAG TPA: hypothetical protein VMF32_11125 [Xanthobacteraceae bacterium]|nr:hypothetical protein [Xanthobacteraceae bacterium]